MNKPKPKTDKPKTAPQPRTDKLRDDLRRGRRAADVAR